MNLIELPGGDRFLHFTDRPRHLDIARAGNGTVENRMTADDSELLVEDLQPFGGGAVAAVENKPVRSDDRSRSEVFFVRPK